MTGLKDAFVKINQLEECAIKKSPIHRLVPETKLLVTLVFLACVVSFPPNRVSGLMIFFLYPFIMMAIAEIPFSLLIKRLSIALPFPLIAGISNLFFDRQIVGRWGNFPITGGMLSLLSLLCKTILCVSSVLILIGSTPLEEISKSLRRFHVPSLFIEVLEMIYRYLSVLMEEAGTMRNAYFLRNPEARFLMLRDMGGFLGKLLLRSYDRVESIYEAMNLRGYLREAVLQRRNKWKRNDVFFLYGWILFFLLFRLFNVSEWIGNLFVNGVFR